MIARRNMEDKQMNLAILKLVQRSGICIRMLSECVVDLGRELCNNKGEVIALSPADARKITHTISFVINKLSFED
jgi:hypothetical protein